MFRFSGRWFALRTDLLCVACIVSTAGISIFFRQVMNSVKNENLLVSKLLHRDDTSSAESGVALSNIFPIATFVPFLLGFTAEFKARLNSVERVWRYATVSV